jgi:hypothetical protein
MGTKTQGWSLVCHLDDDGSGDVAIITRQGEGFVVKRLPGGAESGLEAERRPLFLGVDAADQFVILSAEDRSIRSQGQLPADAFPIYSYREPKTGYVWFVSDGDKDSGNDVLNCGTSGSPVIVVRGNDNGEGELVRLICMGRGHHVVSYVEPCERHPAMPARVFVSNLLDGSICVVANDPADSASYLQVIETINLCESGKEKDGRMAIPNNAFPHGQVYSSRTGKIYSFNNGYSTVAVIDPISCAIEALIEMKVSSNLLMSPDERFLIGKGADRKSDAEHVMGRLSVIDIDQGKVVTTLDLPDVYPSVYRFSPDGTRLYVTTAATGKGVQHDNINMNSLLVYDATALPELRLLREVTVGVADCGRRPLAFDPQGQFVFIPNPTDATVSILNGADDTVVETIRVGDGPATEVNFSFWRGDVYGA